MAQDRVSGENARLVVENIGGIERTTAELETGITVLTGRNATNRTSFLQAIMAVLGSDNATLKADSDHGTVELAFDDETATRTLERQGDTVTMTGDPYLDDPTLADLFAFLLESNECRRAVARGDDLREILMRPVDTASIEAEIQRRESDKENIDSKIESILDLERRLPNIEEKKTQLEVEIEKKERKLAEKREELANIDADVEETKGEKEELEKKLNDLGLVRDDLENVRHQTDSETQSIEALETEKDELESEFEDEPPVSDQKITGIGQEIQRLRGQVDVIERTATELQSIIQFNAEFLEDEHPEFATELQDDSADDALTDELLGESATVTRWTCGTAVERAEIESTLDQLRSLRERKTQNRHSLEREIDSLQTERKELEAEQAEHRRLQKRIAETDREIEERRESLASLREQKEELSDEVVNLEAAIEELQEADYSAVLEVSEEVNKLEFEIDRLESERSNYEDEIERIEAQIDEREQLETRRNEIQNELNGLRTRVETLQEQAIDEFNDHMVTVLDLLEYENLERVWIERTRENVREGRRKVERERFELHVVRSTDDGTVYEDTVDHLSESEREITGLVFALAGYLVHEVYDEVPFMLLDSIEAIDSERIVKVVEYLESFADHLVVALLEEDAAALSEDYPRITSL